MNDATSADEKIIPGTPQRGTLIDGSDKPSVTFKDASHPGMNAALAAQKDVEKTLAAKLKVTDFLTDLEALEKSTLHKLATDNASARGIEVVRETFAKVRAAMTADQDVRAVVTHVQIPGLKENLEHAIRDLIEKHAPQEINLMQTTRRDYEKAALELAKEQAKLLKNTKSVEGMTSEELSHARTAHIRKLREADRKLNPSWFKDNYARMREEGLQAAITENFTPETFKQHPGESFLKGAGVAVGAAFTLDAIIRSQHKDDTGKDVERHRGVRLGEALAGLGLAAGVALHGGR